MSQLNTGEQGASQDGSSFNDDFDPSEAPPLPIDAHDSRVVPDPLDFISLPTDVNHRALDQAYRATQLCLFSWAEENGFTLSDHSWDTSYDVAMEFGKLNHMLDQNQGWAGRRFDYQTRRALHATLPRLSNFRNLWAHPDDSRGQEGTLEVISRHITSALDVATLLGDTATVEQLTDMLRRLKAKARRCVKYCERRLRQSLDDTPWPRNLERTFETLSFLSETQKGSVHPQIQAAAFIYNIYWRGPGQRQRLNRRPVSAEARARKESDLLQFEARIRRWGT